MEGTRERAFSFIEDLESLASDYAGAEGVGVVGGGPRQHLRRGVVRRRALERHASN
jgi:hypothetical protein